MTPQGLSDRPFAQCVVSSPGFHPVFTIPYEKTTRTTPITIAFVLLWLLRLGNSGTALAQCAAPMRLSVASPTGTTAQVTFTPSATALSYTVTYTSTSTGTVTTVSPNPTSSPARLTGSLPLSSYTGSAISNCANHPPPAGLAQRNRALVGLYPTPAHRAATLTMPASLSRQPGQVVLSNSPGQLVHRQVLPITGSVDVLLTGLATGVYTVQAQAGTAVVTKRLVIE